MRYTLLSIIERLALINLTKAVERGRGQDPDVMVLSRVLSTDRVQVLGGEIRAIIGKLRAPRMTPLGQSQEQHLQGEIKEAGALIGELADKVSQLRSIAEQVALVGAEL